MDDVEVSFPELSWSDVVRVFRSSEAGHLEAQAEGEWVELEFNVTHAAVLYGSRDSVTLRPYFPHRTAESQDLRPFVDDVGLWCGDRDEYLERFVSREAGFRLFKAVLVSPTLPETLPDPHPGQLVLPGFEDTMAELAVRRSIEWRPELC